MTKEEYSLVASDLMRVGRYLDALNSVENPIVREALTLAAIVSYCRPFHISRDAEKKRRRWVPQTLVDDLPSACAVFHKQLLAARDQAWAHTDWSAHTPRSQPGSDFVISNNPWMSLSPAELAEFQTLLGEINKRVEAEMGRA